uniref:Uncharacterized protein n=1 Tax=Rhizophora mucronata TaxID=61149 RepID=A0A2P2PNA3_RHIMU
MGNSVMNLSVLNFLLLVERYVYAICYSQIPVFCYIFAFLYFSAGKEVSCYDS